MRTCKTGDKLLEGLLRIKIHGETWLMHTYTAMQWHEISRHVPA